MAKAKQQESRGWGGAREGSGRKPKGDKAGVPHRPRPRVSSKDQVHVTLIRGKGLPSLSSIRARKVLWAALEAGQDRFGCRLTHVSIQADHIQLIVVAKNREALIKSMRGLSIRIARRLNKLWGRSGKVFPDRYDVQILRTPREIRNAVESCPRLELPTDAIQ